MSNRFDGTFEDTAEIGDRIRAWDFERFAGRPERWAEGRVIAKGIVPILYDDGGFPYGGGFAGFTIICDNDSYCHEDTMEGERVGMTIYVPYDNFCDFDYRVEKL